MPMYSRNKVLLCKVETTKGTDAAPVVGSDLIIPLGDLKIGIPTSQDSGEGELKGTFGPGQAVTFKQAMELAFDGRVRGLGQGAASLVTPDIHGLMMASGHAVTTAGNGTSTVRTATYKPTSVPANLKSSSVYLYDDGLLWKLLGAVNDLSFAASMDALKIKAKIQGKYTAPTVVALPTLTLPTQKLYRMTNTLCGLSDGSTLNIGAFTFDCGVKVEEAYETGLQEFNVTDRSPSITIDPRSVATAAEWTALTNATSFNIVATFTNEQAETLVFTAPKAVPMEISRGDRAGIVTSQRKFALKETAAAGDDQYSIVWSGIL